jgi:hypothetical protein
VGRAGVADVARTAAEMERAGVADVARTAAEMGRAAADVARTAAEVGREEAAEVGWIEIGSLDSTGTALIVWL